jgi:hypothetical protein
LALIIIMSKQPQPPIWGFWLLSWFRGGKGTTHKYGIINNGFNKWRNSVGNKIYWRHNIGIVF